MVVVAAVRLAVLEVVAVAADLLRLEPVFSLERGEDVVDAAPALPVGGVEGRVEHLNLGGVRGGRRGGGGGGGSALDIRREPRKRPMPLAFSTLLMAGT